MPAGRTEVQGVLWVRLMPAPSFAGRVAFSTLKRRGQKACPALLGPDPGDFDLHAREMLRGEEAFPQDLRGAEVPLGEV